MSKTNDETASYDKDCQERIKKHLALKTNGKHTSGPWRIGNAGTAVFGPPNGNPSPKTIASELSRADAKLFAAAPEMVDLLVVVLAELEHTASATAQGNEKLKRRRNAITKLLKKAGYLND